VLAGLVATGASAPSGPTAECVVHGTVCTEFRRAQLVFLGEVTAIRNETVSFSATPAQTATFRIIEAFKGVTATQITMRLAVDGEAPRVEMGDRVLVYAPKPDPPGERWFIGCNRTKFGKEIADQELTALRRIKMGISGTAVEGFFVMPKDDQSVTWGDPSGIRITAHSATGSVVTLSVGPNFLLWLTPGQYRITGESATWQAPPTDFTVRRGVSCPRGPGLVLTRRRAPARLK